MKKPSHNICRFSAKTARRRRLICFVFGFLVIAILAIGSALILAFDESTEPPSYTFEFTQSNAAPEFLNSFAKLGRGESGATAYFPYPCNEPQQSNQFTTMRSSMSFLRIRRGVPERHTT